MLRNAERVRRSRGRPQVRSDDETLSLLVEAAAQEFMLNGYGRASVSAVAEAAGVSTKTLYRLVPTKADLFIKVVIERISHFTDVFQHEGDEPDEVGLALERILIAYGTFMLQEETIAVNRLVLSESNRFPEIAAGFYQTAVLKTNSAIADWLTARCESGLLELEDPDVAAGMLRGMMVMEPQRAVMLGQDRSPTRNEVVVRARRCAKLFLDGCRLKTQAGPTSQIE